ncbi:MAG: hypothetical protein WBG08_08575 [Litorimonas sp.]
MNSAVVDTPDVVVGTARPAKDRGKTLATLAALALVAPLNAALVGPAWLLSLFLRCRPGADGPTVLISGGKMTKAGVLARAFQRAGWRVILSETDKYRLTGHRFSRAVSRFVTVPEPTAPDYADALADIVTEHRVDLYVPVCSPVASLHDSQAVPRLEGLCETIHLSPEWIGVMDDKFRFAETALAKGLGAPKSYRITDPAQVLDHDWSNETRPFILKSIAYDAIRRLDLTRLPLPSQAEMQAFVADLPISESNPWVMQEFIEGREYCTHGTVVNGRLTVHIACDSSPFQINYAHLDRPDIRDWVERFVDGTDLTGQISFDFIQADDDGRLYAIECNPRTHSAITLFNGQGGLPAAYLGEADGPALEPRPELRPTYWLYHEIVRLLRTAVFGRDPGQPGFRDRLRILANGRDAVFDWRDPLPFFMLHHVHIPSLLIRDLRVGTGWSKIDFNIGKLVQEGGD